MDDKRMDEKLHFIPTSFTICNNFEYCQIWLNISINDHHLSKTWKFGKKKKHWCERVVLSNTKKKRLARRIFFFLHLVNFCTVITKKIGKKKGIF
jgi:hypothetical protein